MARTLIQPEHAAQLAKYQHVGEWLATERARLERDLGYVVSRMQHLDAEIVALLQRHYGLDVLRQPATIDIERGVIVTPDEPTPAAAPEPKPES